MANPKENKQRSLFVKTGDTVMVMTGSFKNKGKKGKVLSVTPATNRIIVEGVNIVTRHQKPRGAGMPGGIIHKEAAIHASNVMLFCGKCNKPVRVAHSFLQDGEKTRKARVCSKCRTSFDK